MNALHLIIGVLSIWGFVSASHRTGEALYKLSTLRYDHHNGPHPMRDGGCACHCDKCVRLVHGFIKCACPRCNHDCPGTGRLGPPGEVASEQMMGEIRPFKRWYFKRTKATRHGG